MRVRRKGEEEGRLEQGPAKKWLCWKDTRVGFGKEKKGGGDPKPPPGTGIILTFAEHDRL